MPEPSFALAERRSFVIPILAALAVLALAIVLGIHFFPDKTATIAHVKTQLLPTHTVYKSNSIVLGQDHSEDALFVATTVRIENTTRTTIDLENYNLTLTDPTGAELTAKAVNPQDLKSLEVTFPAIKPLEGQQLAQDTQLNPGQSAQGTLIFSLGIPQSVWDTRKDAVLQVDIFHQKPISLVIPKP